MRRAVEIIDGLSENFGKIISWFSIILVLTVCYDVFTRYFLKESSVALQELEWHIFAIIFLLGAGYTLRNDQHVRVDIFYSKLSKKNRAWIDLLGTIVLLIPFCLIAIYASKNFVLNSISFNETSPDPGGLPARYILKTVIPISFLLVLIQGISLIIRSIQIINSEK